MQTWETNCLKKFHRTKAAYITKKREKIERNEVFKQNGGRNNSFERLDQTKIRNPVSGHIHHISAPFCKMISPNSCVSTHDHTPSALESYADNLAFAWNKLIAIPGHESNFFFRLSSLLGGSRGFGCGGGGRLFLLFGSSWLGAGLGLGRGPESL